MKTTAITVLTDKELEQELERDHVKIQHDVRKNAKFFGKQNLPDAHAGKSGQCFGEITGAYMEKIGRIMHRLQPETHFTETCRAVEKTKTRAAEIDTEIKKLERGNETDIFDLSDVKMPVIGTLRVIFAFIGSMVILAGEIALNTRAFQIMGDGLLFALLLSVSLSVAIFFFAHLVPMLFKSAKTEYRRMGIAWGSLLVVTCLSVCIANLRALLLEKEGVEINILYFIGINDFLFIVTALISYVFFPSFDELREKYHYARQQKQIAKRDDKIEQLKKELAQMQADVEAKKLHCLQIVNYAHYLIDWIRKMHKDSVELFKTTNLIYRDDRHIPDCFEESPELESIPVITIPNFETA